MCTEITITLHETNVCCNRTKCYRLRHIQISIYYFIHELFHKCFNTLDTYNKWVKKVSCQIQSNFSSFMNIVLYVVYYASLYNLIFSLFVFVINHEMISELTINDIRKAVT